MKTPTTNQQTATHTSPRVPDAALLGTVEELMASADHGQVAAEARVLAALFGLAALHMAGPARDKAEELRQWYAEEADEVARMDTEEETQRNSEASPLRFGPIHLSAPRAS